MPIKFGAIASQCLMQILIIIVMVKLMIGVGSRVPRVDLDGRTGQHGTQITRLRKAE